MKLELYAMPLPPSRQGPWLALLRSAGLRDDGDCEWTALALDEQDGLAGCGSLRGGVLKQLAVADAARGEGVGAQLVSALAGKAAELGRTRLFVYTKPENGAMFRSLGFYPVARTPEVLMLENRRDGLARFLAPLPLADGCVVMNANPFTRGHQYLVGRAAAACGRVLVFVLSREQPPFPAAARLALVRAGCAGFSNVTVASGDKYLISDATFPGYFLKDPDRAYTALDLTLFAEKIAPALGIVRRFVGEEPFCPVTAAYNEAMRRLLPPRGIAVTELPRFENIRAGEVRRLLAAGDWEAVRQLVPETTYEYCRNHAF